MNKTSKIIILGLLILLLGSCKKNEQFTISGTVAGATDKVLYLEQLGLDETILLDSVRLTDQGKFRFKYEVPSTLDYYRLRLGAQVIPFSISAPTDLVVNADAESFQISYTIEGSIDAKQMREVWLAQLDTDQSIKRLSHSYHDGELSLYDFAMQRDSILGIYKEKAVKYIYDDPGSATAYFALFQQVDGNLIFNIYDKTDSKSFAAVANLHLYNYPESPRTKHLEQLALNSIAVLRVQEKRAKEMEESQKMAKEFGANELPYIDFKLPDKNNQEVSLSSIVSSFPTLLCFSTMEANWSLPINQQISAIYDTFAQKGLKIVQVSLDRDIHLWRSATEGLPWIHLQERKESYSELVGYYNLSSLPTFFYFEKGGEKMYRITSAEQLLALLNKL